MINRSYLFRKNFAGGVVPRLQFVMLIGLLMGHRVVNREWGELRGLIEGSVRSWSRPLERPVTPRSARPRVAFVSSHAKAGGSERYLGTLLGLLERETVGPIVSLEGGPLVDRLRTEGFHVDVVASSGSLLSMLGAARRARPLLRTHAAEVVHANGVKAALVSVLARPRIPIVWVKHDYSYDGRVAHLIARRVAAIVGVSDAVLATFPPSQRDKARVVHTGIQSPEVDRDVAGRKLHAEVGADAGDPLIGLVGRFHPVKGHLDFIRAAERVLADRPQTRMIFVGGDDPSVPHHGEEVRAAVRALGSRAHLLGHRDDITNVMAGLDVGVMASHRDGGSNVEALPLTALEMLAVGTPLVAYASGGIPELVGDCAVLVPTGDIDGLSDALISLIDDPDSSERLSRCGPARVAEGFSLRDMVEKMVEIYAAAGSS